MNKTNNTLIIFLGFVMFSLMGCGEYGTVFVKEEMAETYERKEPCNPPVVIKIDSLELANYELIGTCKTNMPASGRGGSQNNAFIQVRKCTCFHGGDLAKIIYSGEVSGATEGALAAGGLSNINNPLANKKVYSDMIEAKIYRKIK